MPGIELSLRLAHESRRDLLDQREIIPLLRFANHPSSDMHGAKLRRLVVMLPCMIRPTILHLSLIHI